jgi:1-acyl-sn-glycerol-3-phosphate acyltransferase
LIYWLRSRKLGAAINGFNPIGCLLRNNTTMLLSLVKKLFLPLFRLLFAVEYHGLENVPSEGAVIIAGNHPSYLDPVLVMLPVKRPIRFMAWDALFKIPLMGSVIRALGAFPVDLRKGKGEAAFQQALRVLKRGDVLGIFPEGQRSEQGPMGELRTGVARLALETGAAIVPVTIGGASRAWPKWKLLPKPAKIVVHFHRPLELNSVECALRAHEKEFHREIMERLAARINRSLRPALREAAQIEKWYAQPPSNIRTYEWAPLVAALITSFVAVQRGTWGAGHWGIWLPTLCYYGYLAADLLFIKPGRLAKWLRNSMPIWLILLWHYPLMRATALPTGERNGWLCAALLASFFPFFYEDYYSLQKFVRGVVVSYYFSLALLLEWPHPLGTMVTVLGFVVIFCWRNRIVLYQWTASLLRVVLGAAVWLSATAREPLILFAALPLLVLLYLQTFVGAAYDIRRAGDVTSDITGNLPEPAGE